MSGYLPNEIGVHRQLRDLLDLKKTARNVTTSMIILAWEMIVSLMFKCGGLKWVLYL